MAMNNALAWRTFNLICRTIVAAGVIYYFWR